MRFLNYMQVLYTLHLRLQMYAFFLILNLFGDKVPYKGMEYCVLAYGFMVM
jgi:hypothetical protein